MCRSAEKCPVCPHTLLNVILVEELDIGTVSSETDLRKELMPQQARYTAYKVRILLHVMYPYSSDAMLLLVAFVVETRFCWGRAVQVRSQRRNHKGFPEKNICELLEQKKIF